MVMHCAQTVLHASFNLMPDQIAFPPAAMDQETLAVDAVAAALLARSRALLKEKDQIQQRIQSALLKFRPSDGGSTGAVGGGASTSPTSAGPGVGTVTSATHPAPATGSVAASVGAPSVQLYQGAQAAAASGAGYAAAGAGAGAFGIFEAGAGAHQASAGSRPATTSPPGTARDEAPSWRDRLVGSLL